MGAQVFTADARGRNAREAFNEAVADAVHWYGHDAYNGTISTCTGSGQDFIEIALNEGESIEDWQRRMWDDERVEKWGPCGCVQDRSDPELWHFSGWAAT